MPRSSPLGWQEPGFDQMSTLIQVVPPGEGGVVDYANCLRAEWHRQGLASELLALSRSSAHERPLGRQIELLMAASAATSAQRCAIVLHFSGYGYDRRGLCWWLLEELTALRSRVRESARVVVVFHELFASGPPWRSAFWLSQLQAAIAARLARRADALWTNADEHALWLRRAVPAGVPVHVRPVFSNVGEGDASTSTVERQPRAVVFGSPSTRHRVFEDLQRFDATLKRLGVQELVEVGSGGESTNRRTALPCRHLGRLDPPTLSALLQASRFGLLDYPSALLAKSGVFAAYAAHGCVVLDTRPPGPNSNGLVAGRDYLNLCVAAITPRRQPSLDQHRAMALRLLRWYGAHRLAQQASELRTLAHG